MFNETRNVMNVCSGKCMHVNKCMYNIMWNQVNVKYAKIEHHFDDMSMHDNDDNADNNGDVNDDNK